MSKAKSQKLVPKLRFLEFKDAGPWKEKGIGKLTKVVAGATPTSTTKEYWDGDIPWMSSGELNHKRIYSVQKHITKLGYNNSSTKLVPPDSILIGLAGQGKTRGTAAITYIELCTNQSIASILPNPDKFVSEFLYNKMDSLYHFLRSLSKGDGGRGGLNLKIIKSIKLPLPLISEQQKIADCLSSLDELIQCEGDRLETLKAHKTGLMQQLFPQDGETTPRLRFPEFHDAGPWMRQRLGKIATFSKGKGISKSDISPNGSVPCIRYGELYTEYQETIDEVVSYTNIPPKNLVLSQANDVIIPASGETKIDIATASCVVRSNVALGGDLNIIRSKINGVFLSYYLNGAKKPDIAGKAQGVSVVHIYPSQLKTLNVAIPRVNEQQKIADCLSSLNERITIHTQHIETLKVHKKGLMQQLFANPDVEEGP